MSEHVIDLPITPVIEWTLYAGPFDWDGSLQGCQAVSENCKKIWHALEGMETEWAKRTYPVIEGDSLAVGEHTIKGLDFIRCTLEDASFLLNYIKTLKLPTPEEMNNEIIWWRGMD